MFVDSGGGERGGFSGGWRGLVSVAFSVGGGVKSFNANI